MPQRKIRPSSKRKEVQALNELRAYCEQHDLIFQAEPREDFGVDCYIEVALPGLPLNFIVGVQSKAGRSHIRRFGKDRFKLDLRQSDLNYWLAANYPIFLIYFDNATSQQYFKHVQVEWESSRANVRYLDFGPEDLVKGPNLAENLRDLVKTTPSTADRIEVMTSRILIHWAHLTFELEQPLQHRPLSAVTTLLRTESSSAGSRILGFSADERWSIEFDVQEMGMTGYRIESVFVRDLDCNRHVPFELAAQSDFESAMDNPRRHKRLVRSRANQLAKQLIRIAPVEAITLPTPASTDETGFQTIASDFSFSFGTQCFDLCIESDGWNQKLLLKNSRYSPPRTATILTERVGPVGDHSFDLDALVVSRRFNRIVSAALSPSGKLLALTVETNPEHLCWGTTTFHMVYVTTTKLRDLCRAALI